MHHMKDRDRSSEAEALRTACQQEGCPICSVILEQITHAMNTWSHEGFTDIEHRQEVMRARGFCPLHTWQLAQRNNAFQLGVVYENILSTLLEDLARYEQGQTQPEKMQRNWLTEIKRLFPSGSPSLLQDPMSLYEQCAFCKIQATTEQRLIERLVGLLQTEEAMLTLLSQSTGLCRVHFTQALQYAQTHTPAQCSMLITCQQTCIQRVLSDLRELIRKHDYHFSQEEHGEEMTSWRRAATLCAGNLGVHS